MIGLSVDDPGDGTILRQGSGLGGNTTDRFFADMSTNGIRIYNNIASYIGHHAYVALMKR